MQTLDLRITNARLIDGSGGASTLGGLAVADDRIFALGDVSAYRGGREIDAGGLALAPGFIDSHTHDDRALLVNPTMDCKVSQGVTSVVTGNCGISLAPLDLKGRPPAPLDLLSPDPQDFFADFSAYLERLDSDPAATNALCQVGHSSLRVAAMESLERPADAGEIRAMRRALEASLAAGAMGFSTGLGYAPATAAPTEEIVALAGALAEAPGGCGLHTTHMRDEGDRIAEALTESFAIGRAAKVPLVISHFKCHGAQNLGRSRETLSLLDAARSGQSVGLDVYPYDASSTVLEAGYIAEAGRIVVTWSDPHPEMSGRDLSDIAAEWGVERLDAAERLQPAGAIYFMMDEADVRRILTYPHSMIGSDGLPHDRHPHPRLWGSFPRVLGHYARDEGLFSLEEAVRKMTGLTADTFGLTDRGRLAPGQAADLVLFDPATVADLATFERPCQAAAGIREVWVNGRSVWREGAATGARPGRAIRRQSLSLSHQGIGTS
ncbi:MAG: D-aminoacylase [Rhodospirillales bacterium]